MDEKFVNIIGNSYGRWTVLSSLDKIKGESLKLRCVCRCGVIRTVIKTSVISGKSLSCGCYAREKSAERLQKPDVLDCFVGDIFFKSTFNNTFGVSKCGLVIGRKGFILKPKSQGHYSIVSYSCIDNGKVKIRHKYIHRLVATVWVEKKNDSYEIVNHKDGDKLNNHSENLEWVNYKLNTQHAVRTGLLWNLPKRGEQGFQKLKELQNDC